MLSVDMNNYSPIAGMQFDVVCPEGLTPQVFEVANRTKGFSFTLQPIGENTWRVLLYSLSGQSVSPGEGLIGTVRFDGDAQEKNGESLSLTNIVLSDASSDNCYSGSQDPSCIIDYVLVGDVNEDEVVNVMDATMLIGAYLQGTTDQLPQAVADVNHDGIINVMDATEIINIYLHNR